MHKGLKRAIFFGWVLVWLGWGTPIHGQVRSDSLQRLLDTAQHNISRFQLLENLSTELWRTQPAAGLKYGHEAMAIAQQQADSLPFLMKAQRAIGGCHYFLAQYQEANQAFTQSLVLARKGRSSLEDSTAQEYGMYSGYVARNLNNLAMLHNTTGVYDLALGYATDAVEEARALDDTVTLAAAMNNLGRVFMNTGVYAEARRYLKASLTMKQQAGLGSGRIIHSSINLADFHLQVKEYDSARSLYRSTELLCRLQNDQHNLANALLGQARIALAVMGGERAEELLAEALAIQQETGDELGQVSSYHLMHQLAMAQGNDPMALDYLASSLRLSQRISAKAQTMETHRLYALYHKGKGQYERAMANQEQYQTLYQELMTEERRLQTMLVQATFDLSAKDDEISRLSEERAKLLADERVRNVQMGNVRNIMVMLGLLVVLVVVLLIMILMRIQARHKATLLMEGKLMEISEQKEQIEAQHEIIHRKNQELEQAQATIKSQNDKLLQANVQLKDAVNNRTMELVDAYKKLSFHIDNTPLAVVEFDRDMRIIRWSKQAVSLFGWSAEDVLNKRIWDIGLVHDEDHEQMSKVVADLTRGKTLRNFFMSRNHTKNGQVLYMEWSNTIFTDKRGELQSILSIANDVTAREMAVQELKASNKELDDFIYKSSHDLRGPLARMQGIINLGIKEASADGTSEMYFTMLNRVTFELNMVLGQLSMIHTILQHTPTPEDVLLREVVENSAKKMMDMGSGLQVMVDVAPDLEWRSDRSLMTIIFDNMVENAYAYFESKSGSTSYVKFSVQVKEDELLVFVADNGYGIVETDRHKVFDIFFQGSPNPGNSGLNLYLVKKAVQRLGGDIRLIRPSKDTIFEISIPGMADEKKPAAKPRTPKRRELLRMVPLSSGND